jgi:transcriptional regulator with XRE-family HTH domain
MKDEFKENYKRLGLKIAYYRRLREYTQEKLAEAVDMNATFLGQIECGSKGVSLDKVFAISKFLDVPTHKFFCFDND